MQSGRSCGTSDIMPTMKTGTGKGRLIVARVYVTKCVLAWGLIDAGGLAILDRANTPNWDRSVSGIERPVFDPGVITTLASGEVAIVRVIVGNK